LTRRHLAEPPEVPPGQSGAKPGCSRVRTHRREG
jgi:hypothetical protein